MISAARTESRQGFTLLEMVMVLVIIGLVVGSAVGVMIHSSDERALGRATSGIEIMAKRARMVAILQQTPYALEFSDHGVRMMPLAEALMPMERREEFGGLAEGSRFSPVYAEWVPDEDQELFIRRWASTNWLPVTNRAAHIWRFDPDGICEPVAVRVQMEKSWAEAEFHPLTGTIRESFLEANK